MIKVLIIEDEEAAALRLQKMLHVISPELEVIGICESIVQSVEWLQQHTQPDLIFLDIQVSDGISFEIFNQVSVSCPIIVVTAYDAYALKAFEVNSIDYLLKPLRKELLESSILKFKKFRDHFSPHQMMEKVQQMLDVYQNGYLPYKSRFAVTKGDTLTTVQSDDIAYFYIEDKALFLVTHQKARYLINFSMEQLEEVMNPAAFFRVNRQCMVSIRAIEKVHTSFNYKLKLQLKPEAPFEVIVSANKTKEFRVWLDA